MKRVIRALLLGVLAWALTDSVLTFRGTIGAPLWLRIALAAMSLCASLLFIGLLFTLSKLLTRKAKQHTLAVCVLASLLSPRAYAQTAWQIGKLLSVNDSESNRIAQNSQTGAIQNVTDIEYRLNVELDGMVYVCSYSPHWRWSYEPNDFIVNDSVKVRVEGKHLYLKRPNGKELKTSIVRQIRYSSAQKLSAQ